jgi:hypothetical protein
LPGDPHNKQGRDGEQHPPDNFKTVPDHFFLVLNALRCSMTGQQKKHPLTFGLLLYFMRALALSNKAPSAWACSTLHPQNNSLISSATVLQQPEDYALWHFLLRSPPAAVRMCGPQQERR